MFSTSKLLPVVVLALCLAPQAESQASQPQFRFLCTSISGACEYAPPDAPAFDTNVCYLPATGEIRLKGTASCPVGAWPYAITHGEVVDPVLGVVVPYVPLNNACDAGLCVDYVPHPPGTENAMCCDEDGVCWPGGTCGGVLYWCFDGVSNDDGTVECFHAEEL